MAIPPPLLRGRRQAALRRRAALHGALVGAGARPKAAASGLASIKHAKLQARIIVAFRRRSPAVFRQRGALIAIKHSRQSSTSILQRMSEAEIWAAVQAQGITLVPSSTTKSGWFGVSAAGKRFKESHCGAIVRRSGNILCRDVRHGTGGGAARCAIPWAKSLLSGGCFSKSGSSRGSKARHERGGGLLGGCVKAEDLTLNPLTQASRAFVLRPLTLTNVLPRQL
jgi:hypothetical protein